MKSRWDLHFSQSASKHRRFRAMVARSSRRGEMIQQIGFSPFRVNGDLNIRMVAWHKASSQLGRQPTAFAQDLHSQSEQVLRQICFNEGALTAETGNLGDWLVSSAFAYV